MQENLCGVDSYYLGTISKFWKINNISSLRGYVHILGIFTS